MCQKVLARSLAVMLALSACGSSKPSRCRSDADCPTNQGCNLADLSDGYCAPLCTVLGDCPPKLTCPEMPPLSPDCDEQGQHRDGKGVCQLYAGSHGPNSCATAQGDGGSSDAAPDASADARPDAAFGACDPVAQTCPSGQRCTLNHGTP